MYRPGAQSSWVVSPHPWAPVGAPVPSSLSLPLLLGLGLLVLLLPLLLSFELMVVVVCVCVVTTVSQQLFIWHFCLFGSFTPVFYTV